MEGNVRTLPNVFLRKQHGDGKDAVASTKVTPARCRLEAQANTTWFRLDHDVVFATPLLKDMFDESHFIFSVMSCCLQICKVSHSNAKSKELITKKNTFQV